MDADAVGDPDCHHQQHEREGEQAGGELTGAFGGRAQALQQLAADGQDEHAKDHPAANGFDGDDGSGPKAGEQNRQHAPGSGIANGARGQSQGSHRGATQTAFVNNARQHRKGGKERAQLRGDALARTI